MLIHDRFVFLHVPKTGGRFVRRALSQEVPGCRAVSGSGSRHYGWSRIPEEAAGRPVLAFVRNPWDWYVSWYSFVAGLPQERLGQLASGKPLFRKFFVTDAGHAGSTGDSLEVGDFNTTIRRACAADFYVASLESILGVGLGSDRLRIGRFESLTDDLEAFIARAGIDLSDGAVTRIRAMDPVGASERRQYRAYYDDELCDLVGSSCRSLIERFEYSF